MRHQSPSSWRAGARNTSPVHHAVPHFCTRQSATPMKNLFGDAPSEGTSNSPLVSYHSPQLSPRKLNIVGKSQSSVRRSVPVQPAGVRSTVTEPVSTQHAGVHSGVGPPKQAEQLVPEPEVQCLLRPGMRTSVGGYSLVVGDCLGEGAYASVWSARVEGSPNDEVAIKEMLCGKGPGILTDATLERARFEARVMQQLSTCASEDTEMRTPRFFDHQIWPVGPCMPEAYVCRIVMERLPGSSLISWLAKRTTLCDAGNSRPGSSSSRDTVGDYCASFLRAAGCARAMLQQLGPTFQRMNEKVVFHRDVNARNIMVHYAGGEHPGLVGAAPADPEKLEFCVVDMGSSVDAAAWLEVGGRETWRTVQPTGDARYWGPASWLRFTGSANAIARDRLLWQYQHRLDVFALSICALECLTKLHTAQVPTTAELEKDGHTAKLVQSVQKFMAAWTEYWQVAVSSFETLARYSQLCCMGDIEGSGKIWQRLKNSDIPQGISERLQRLSASLLTLSRLCRTHRSGTCEQSDESRQWLLAGKALEVLRDMVDPKSMLHWEELCLLVDSAGEKPGWSPSWERQASEKPFQWDMVDSSPIDHEAAAGLDVAKVEPSDSASVFSVASPHDVTVPQTIIHTFAALSTKQAPTCTTGETCAFSPVVSSTKATDDTQEERAATCLTSCSLVRTSLAPPASLL